MNEHGRKDARRRGPGTTKRGKHPHLRCSPPKVFQSAEIGVVMPLYVATAVSIQNGPKCSRPASQAACPGARWLDTRLLAELGLRAEVTRFVVLPSELRFCLVTAKM
jgi:hypothetical protein